MLRKNKSLFILSAIFVLVHGGDAAFRFRGLAGLSGRGDSYNNNQQYRSAGYNYRSSSSSNIAGVPIGLQGSSAHSVDDQKPVNDQIKTAGGLSAWGIVAIIVGVILLGTGGYYVFVFYPYICKKERNYDMIELTNVL